MSLLQNVKKTGGKRALRMLFYALQGWGKTTFLSQVGEDNPDSVLLLRTENGTGRTIKMNYIEITCIDDLFTAFRELAETEHQYKVVGIDTITGLEPMVAQQVLQQWNGERNTNLQNLEAIGYGKGYKLARTVWRDIAQWITYLAEYKGVSVILLSHAILKTFNNPGGDNYDWWQISLDKELSLIHI